MSEILSGMRVCAGLTMTMNARAIVVAVVAGAMNGEHELEIPTKYIRKRKKNGACPTNHFVSDVSPQPTKSKA